MSYRRRYKAKKTSWERIKNDIDNMKTILIFVCIALLIWIVKEWVYISSWIDALIN